MTYADLTPEEQSEWADLDEISKAAPIWRSETGVLRFEKDPVIRFAMTALSTAPQLGMSLDDLWEQARREHWPLEPLRAFYRGAGFSLSAFMGRFEPYAGQERL